MQSSKFNCKLMRPLFYKYLCSVIHGGSIQSARFAHEITGFVADISFKSASI